MPDGLSIASNLGPSHSFAVTKQYNKGTVVRRYREAIEDGITETELTEDLKWMMAQAKLDNDVNSLLKVWRFVMEYTMGKPVPVDLETANTTITIIEALERGAEYMAQIAPPEQETSHEPDSQSQHVPGIDGAPGDDSDTQAARDS